jgi:hypothetical protein
MQGQKWHALKVERASALKKPYLSQASSTCGCRAAEATTTRFMLCNS